MAKAADGKDVTSWYAWFLENTVLPNAKVFGFMVAYGELLVGLGLVVGLLTGIAAFFGGLMNVSFLFAGTVSTNPLLFVFATWLVMEHEDFIHQVRVLRYFFGRYFFTPGTALPQSQSPALLLSHFFAR